MKLFLVRHATATEGIGGNIRSDAERPLIPEGKKEAEAVASALKKLGVRGDGFITSPLVRARQTAEIFCEILGGKDKFAYCEALAPGGSTDELFSQLNKLRKVEEVFLFGHQPDMSYLAQTLLHSDELDMPFKKAGVCRIDVADLPPTSPGTLKWFITPKIAASFSK
jgi:phosphohistidine phosphatase